MDRDVENVRTALAMADRLRSRSRAAGNAAIRISAPMRSADPVIRKGVFGIFNRPDKRPPLPPDVLFTDAETDALIAALKHIEREDEAAALRYEQSATGKGAR